MDWTNATPLAALTGGILIGLACAIMLLGLGRIAGVSGLAAAVSALYKHQRLVALVEAGTAANRARARTLLCSLVQVHGSWACSASP